MSIELTEEQRQAVLRGEPVRVADPELGKEVVLLPAERFQEIQDILEDEDPRHFVLEGDSFRWKELRVELDQIQAARNKLVTSFGSCSIEEPLAGLRALGFL